MTKQSDDQASVSLEAGPVKAGAKGSFVRHLFMSPEKELRSGLADIVLEKFRRGVLPGALSPAEQMLLAASLEPIVRRAERFARVLKRAEEVHDDVVKLFRLPAGSGGELPPISEDWLNRFRREAEEVSDETICDIFARVLAGEASRPGSFSLLTIDKLAVVDARIAKALAGVRPYLINGSWLPAWGGLKKYLISVNKYVGELVSAGLATDATGGAPYPDNDDTRRGVFFTVGRAVEVIGSEPPSVQQVGPGLTRPGFELATLIAAAHDEEYFQAFLTALWETRAKGRFSSHIISIQWAPL